MSVDNSIPTNGNNATNSVYAFPLTPYISISKRNGLHNCTKLRRVAVSGMKEFLGLITKNDWSPVVFNWDDKEGTEYRAERNFLGTFYCVLDFDTPETPLAQAVNNIFCDMKHIIATTKNHQKDKKETGIICDRYRVIIPFEKPITCLRDYRFTMHTLIRRYGADTQCKDGARYFFPCEDNVVSTCNEQDAYKMETYVAPEDFEPVVIHQVLENVSGGVPPQWAASKFIRNYNPSNRNNSVYGFAKDLFTSGFRPEAVSHVISTFDVYQKCPLEVTELKRTIESAYKNLTGKELRL